MLARLRELAALVLDFVEQPHVLDCDHRLVGEGRDQIDLLVGERFSPNLRVNVMTPIVVPSRSSGTPRMSAIARKFCGLAPDVFRITANIGEMNDFSLEQGSAGNGLSSRLHGKPFPCALCTPAEFRSRQRGDSSRLSGARYSPDRLRMSAAAARPEISSTV